MNFYFNYSNILLAGSRPDVSNLMFIAGAGGFILVLAGNIGLILAAMQMRRGKKRMGWQSHKQAITAICVGGAGIMYYFIGCMLSWS